MLEKILRKLKEVSKKSNGYKALCPAHDDHNPSLEVWEKNGQVRFKCWAGCKTKEIKKHLELEDSRNVSANYDYRDINGQIVYRICRTENKVFFVQHEDNGKFVPGRGDAKPIPYNLPGVVEAIEKKFIIFIPEGEKDVENLLNKLKVCATCNPFGAGKWKPEYSEYLKGAVQVVVLADNDKPGLEHAEDVAKKIKPFVANVKILKLPGLGDKEDVSDWIKKGGTREQLFRLVEETPVWMPQTATPLEPTFHATDIGNAERFVAQHGKNIRYCHPMNTWFIWDDTRWAPDQKACVYHLAIATIKQMYEETSQLDQKSDREALVKHVLKSESKLRVDAMVSLASKKQEICLLPEDLDKDPMLFNVLNGTVNLKTGLLQKHQQEDLITKLAPVRYDRNARCDLWLKFLRDITCGNQELQDYLQVVAGYCLTGKVSEQKLFFLHGQGENGKSVFLLVLLGVFGDYGTKTASEFLLKKPAGAHTTDTTDLKGVRLAVTVEAGEGQRMAVSLVKELTGSDIIKARRMRQDNMQWKPTHKIWLAANHKPVVNETTVAIWRRIDLIPFNMVLSPEKKRRDLEEELLKERDGIFQWALEGCLKWQKEGLKQPPAVVEATRQYRGEMDILGDFFEDRCILSPAAQETKKKLSQAYTGWCIRNGVKEIGQKSFCSRLRERGIKDTHIKGQRGWAGIGLKALKIVRPRNATKPR